MISRREMLVATATSAMVTAASAEPATFGNPDEPPQGAINAKNPASLTDPGPSNPAIASQFPSAKSPPPTDVGDMPMFWASFNNAPKRIQNGGWARRDASRFCHFGHHIRRRHAADCRRHTGNALALGGRMGVHVLWQLPRYH